ncbi:nuclear transport factor 2 family protein [Caenimonas soli]|uniref:nuclear transport factor 2 family protein n=1 Tax=Caenimonas soli TaxID=2735555 RepID=UPI0015531982|nr:nuclear transport factor 2 family protein [Caenimonas soli]NPC55923.1 SnoaL-like domain-containing protein [Caenimonas soli]
MNTANEALCREFLKTMDAQGDVFALLTDDVELLFPKWGLARGKEDLGRLYQSLGPYIRSISHDASSFRYLSDGDRVCIEGVSSGELVDGRKWQPDGGTAGRFCTTFQVRDRLISRVFIYIDPDYTDQTAGFYPWRK